MSARYYPERRMYYLLQSMHRIPLSVETAAHQAVHAPIIIRTRRIIWFDLEPFTQIMSATEAEVYARGTYGVQ